MGKYYLLEFDKDNYVRMKKLIERDENARVKMRERMREKSPDAHQKKILKGKVTFKLIDKSENPFPIDNSQKYNIPNVVPNV